ncbi:glutathione S-transferase family protein [Phanerochaete sordida]|uniref:glutathione transferase n=1 Tax=Phanerochaete sordida TaxID=48140 RepID=A0A9P3GAF3_9APHY|nr:glutathione S-transferase family protein [Phanerochaete sordida]
MSHGKQFTLWTHKTSPHGWKIVFVLEEFGFTWEPKWIDINKNEQKDPAFTKYNPNGRAPALIDHTNNDFTIWESNAILQYLVDKYDKARTISIAPGTDEYYIQLQWLYFQGSGQGPYYGQLAWFILYGPEKPQSVLDRYRNEILRVMGVLEDVLSKQEWLVGGRLTVADISFFTWNAIVVDHFLGEGFDFAKEFPAVAKWHEKILERPAIKAAWDERKRLAALK